MLLLLAENGSRIHRYSGARTVDNLAEFARVRADNASSCSGGGGGGSVDACGPG